MIQILIADDNSRARDALRLLVEQDVDWKVCGEAIDGGDAVHRAMEMNPDLILLDFQMPVMNGLQVACEIAKTAPGIPVLLCTAHLSRTLIDEARKCGIRGAVLKWKPTEIVDGIRALLRHESFFCQPEPNHDFI